jgi:hypothetical protein
MLKSFLEFITESQESKVTRIYYSVRLRELLYKIERTSSDPDVSRSASAIRHSENSNQMSLDITLIDLTERNDMLSFIQVNRIKRKYDDPNVKPSKESFDSFEDWLAFIGQSNPDNTLWTDQRGEIGIGKFTRKLFKDNGYNLNDQVLEKFVNFYKATFDFDNDLDSKIQLVSGEDIRKWYLESNYSSDKGQLANSCMRYAKCQSYLDIYVNNPGVCNLLIMYSDASKTKISGRALVWKTMQDKIIMDRIYTTNDFDIELFKKYAKSKGWESVDWKKYTIKLQKGGEYKNYPYMDNFCYYNYRDGILSNDDDVWTLEDWIRIQNTDGTYTEDRGVWSEYYGDFISRENSVYCQNVDDYISTDDAIYLEYKNIWASPIESTVYSEWADQNYYLDDTVYSEIFQDYLLTDDTVPIFTNCYGDEDYIPKSFSKNLLISVEKDGEKFDTISKFVIKDPTTGNYYFRDDKEMVQDIKNNLQDITVDKDKIKEYLSKIDFQIDQSKFRHLKSLYKTWIPSTFGDNEFTKGVIKYLLYVYPEKSGQRDGLPILPSYTSSRSNNYLMYKNQIINFDKDFLDQLTDGQSDKLKEGSSDTVYNLSRISQSFIEDVFKDPEIYKMWFKWKNT